MDNSDRVSINLRWLKGSIVLHITTLLALLAMAFRVGAQVGEISVQHQQLLQRMDRVEQILMSESRRR
jgi:hypothetical protein